MTDQAQLPSLPPIPKKRGRPATGNAKTAAQRKAEQRQRLAEWSRSQVFGPEDFRLLTLGQMVELLPRLLASCDHEAAAWCCQSIALEIETARRQAAV